MHRKANPIFHDGMKILRISDLSSDQSHLFAGWVSHDNFIILGEQNDYDCVKYEYYEYWYRNHYATEKDLDFSI